VADRHIVAMGGGGFSDEESPALDDFVLALAGKDRPRVCFLAQASGDSDSYIVRFYEAFTARPCDPSHLALFRTPTPPVREHLLTQDVVYVGGGNTANMLALWRLHGADQALRAAWEAGIILAGISAGANCWFEDCVTDSFAPELGALGDGLAFLTGSFCPHYDGDERRRLVYQRLISEGFPAGIAADNGAAVHFVGTGLHEVVSSRPEARAHRVELIDGAVTETPLETRFLA
jgi:dipeptidase E